MPIFDEKKDFLSKIAEKFVESHKTQYIVFFSLTLYNMYDKLMK